MQDKNLDTKTDHEQKVKPLATKSLSEDPQIARITQIQWATDRAVKRERSISTQILASFLHLAYRFAYGFCYFERGIKP